MTPDVSISSLVDAHCHIDLLKDSAKAVADAETRRVHTIAVTNAPSVFFHTRDLCIEKRFVHAALGLHPELIATHGRELDKFRQHLSETRFVGEVGLDYVTDDKSIRQKQRDAFSSIVAQSHEAGGRILTVHTRRAASDAIETLAHGTGNTVILHWFSGFRRELERGVELGFYFSVNCAMASSKNGVAILAALPRERVLTETDAPFARVAGRPSAPRDIKAAATALASVWKLSLEETVAIVDSNFRSILKIHGVIS
jgi:TatD DNase family protein